jgi:PAS domain S-box-containing protein
VNTGSGKSSVSKELPNDQQNPQSGKQEENPPPFWALFVTIDHGIVYQDSSGKIILANPAAERILGLTVGQMMGRESMDPRWKAIREDGSDFPGESHPAMISLKTGKPVKNVLMGVFNPFKGEQRWIRVNSVPLFKNGERKPYQVYTTFEDVTDTLLIEEQRKTSQRELELYTYLMQHDLRNDLQIILTNIEAIELLENYNSANLPVFLRSIRASSERMTNLLKIIDFLKESEETGLVAMLQKIANRSEEVHPGLKVIVESELSTNDVRIPSNHLLSTVFYNLIRNAARYCGKNVVVNIRITDQDGHIIVRVSDNGPGIPESIRPTLFEIGTSTNGGGLGLYLSKQIMEAYKGAITLDDSTPEKGATFLLTLPSDWFPG